MSTLSGSTVLVVGATSVLGGALAQRLVEAGARVIGTASSAQTLDGIPSGVADRLVCDLRDPQSIDATVARVRELTSKLDGVIVAAGLVAFGPARETPQGVLAQLMSVNATGPLTLITSLIDLLQAGAEPYVLTLSGKIAETPTAGLSAYSASKGALYAFAAAASRELRRDGIRWLDARPGHTETGLATRAVFGVAPAFGAGLAPAAVVDRLVVAIEADEKDLPSDAFA